MVKFLKELGKKVENMDLVNYKLVDKLLKDIGIMENFKELLNDCFILISLSKLSTVSSIKLCFYLRN
jgi:hypothetical protein